MPIAYDREYFENKSRLKLIQAERRIEQIHKNHPAIKELDSEINRLKNRYRRHRIEKMSEGEVEELKALIREKEKAREELLAKKGLPVNYKEPEWDCPRCQDLGKYLVDGKYQLCQCAREHYQHLIRKDARLPSKLQQATFANARLNLYSNKQKTPDGESWRDKASSVYSKAYFFSRNYQPENPMRGLIIEGPVGSGKSFLLGCIANQLLERGVPVKYIVYGDLLRKIRASYDSSDLPSEDQLLHEVQEVPVLLIDDLGTENTSEFSATILYQIIDRRYREELPLILTTNHPLNTLQERFSIMNERIFQRLLEMCRYLELVGDVRSKIVEKLQGGEG
ncbi:MAG: ATP-binding protein [Halanaerobium sp.]|nr:ATP-binding protein [Halanaerobium sp.]